MARPLYTHWGAAAEGSRGHCDRMTRLLGVPVEVDLEKLVGAHRIIYESPAETWREGLPLGNGDMAAMVWQPDGAFRWGLSKSDIRDLRNPVIPFHTHEEIVRMVKEGRNLEFDWLNEEEWEHERDIYFPCFLPAGSLTISDPGGMKIVRQTLDLYTAAHAAETAGGGSIESFVYYDANVLAVRICGFKGRRFTAALSQEACPEEAMGKRRPQPTLEDIMRKEEFRQVRIEWSADSAVQQVDYADGNRAVTVMQVRGGVFRPSKAGGASKAELAIDADPAVIMLTITTARESAFLRKRAERTLESAWKRNIGRLFNDHCIFWHERWSRAMLDIPEPLLASLWHFMVYTMASSSRSSFPVPLMSAWNMSLAQPYHGDYHNNINSQMCYWPLFAANQVDLAEAYICHFHSVLPEMEAETRRVWGLPGVKVPFASAGRGLEFWGVGFWRYELFVSGWTAQIAWWHYQHTLDLEFLRTYGWPLIKAVAEFYSAYLVEDKSSGKLCIPLSKTCEDTVFNSAPDSRLVKNSLIDLAAFHALIRDAAKAAQALGLEEDASRYSELLTNMAELPVSEGEFALADKVLLDLPQSHPVTLSPIYPSEIVTAAGPEKLLPVARKTLERLWRCSSRVTVGGPDGRLHWNDDLSMGWIGAARAWMGDGDGALDAILNGWTAGCLKTNGFLSSQARPPGERRSMDWMQNQLCGLANALNEMLLQSHSGVIQVFPAVPRSWKNACFAGFRARGAFLVSALRSAGRTQWVSLMSENGGRAVLANPWHAIGAHALVRTPDGKERKLVLKTDRNGRLILDLKKGDTALITADGKTPSAVKTLGTKEVPQKPRSFSFRPLALAQGSPREWTAWWGKPK